MKKINVFTKISLFLFGFSLYAQDPNDSLVLQNKKTETTEDSRKEIIAAIQKGIVIPLDKKEKSWLKLLVFSQMTGKYNDAPRVNGTAPSAPSSSPLLAYDRQEKNFETAVDRIRVIAAANFFDKVFFFTQFGTAGLGGINNDNINTLALEKESQFSLITSYTELNVNKAFSVGMGLHNYRGISRFANAGLVDLITQDLSIAILPTFAHTDQFSYPLGIFVKGIVGKVRYQFAIDEASRNNISKDLYKSTSDNLTNAGVIPAAREAANPFAPNQISAVYRGAELLGGAKAGTTFSGYLTYHILDEESDRISFRTNSYFGTKKVFNIGAGFFHHPNGSVILDGNGQMKGQNVNMLGVDVFYDAPINAKKDAISAYGLFQTMDYGQNYNLTQYDTAIYPIASGGLNRSASLPFANGNLQYMQLAYFNRKLKVQPYSFFQNRNIDTTKDREITFGFGANYLLVGPNVKLTAEYRNIKLAQNKANDQIVFQLVFFM